MPVPIEGHSEKPELDREYDSHDHSQNKLHISEQSKDFLNRVDMYQVNEE